MKKILGLDLGTTSIGWAFVNEAENKNEESKIIRLGVRVNPLTTDEQQDFEKGKSVTVNADRTLKRGARRNLDRYQQRRDELIKLLTDARLINEDTILTEYGRFTTHQTLELRAKAATERIEKEELARVLLAINKKRGYKSSRKAKSEDEGAVIDGMEVAMQLYENRQTPGQFCLGLLQKGKKVMPDFYRSDLKAEFDEIWNFQKEHYPEVLSNELYKAIEGQGMQNTRKRFLAIKNIYTADNKGTREGKKFTAYTWRSQAVNNRLELSEVAYVLTEINNDLNKSSGYLGAISDRSKELYFNKETVGQNLFHQIQQNPHTRLKSQVFYRQDYLDEFERIWETQKQFHSELTETLKSDIRDTIIFYQRRLKSQKGLISFCEFESKQIEVEIEGKKKVKTIGMRVAPKSSPLFQEFKIWQILANVEAKNKETKEILNLNQEQKQLLFDELNIRGGLSKAQALDLITDNPKKWDLNYRMLEGNKTNQAFYETYQSILRHEGNDTLDFNKLSASEIKNVVFSIFSSLGIRTEILSFNAELDGKVFVNQPFYQLWHLLYSYEGDNSNTGNDSLYKKLEEKFGFKKEHAQYLINIDLQDDYGSLSTKSIRKIFPYIKENNYSEACALSGYNHSKSLTKDENEQRKLKDRLELLPKNSLRNPVVEKILNQMVNVINAIIDDEELGKPDEIRIELARELKKNAKERAEMTQNINKAKIEHESIRKKLQNEFSIANPTRNDIIRYRLYQELKSQGFKTLYTNQYISPEKLFSKEIDIEHIIPKARLYDDSFSNKTLEFRQANIDKSDETAYDFVLDNFGEAALENYKNRVDNLYKLNEISKAKYQKLLKTSDEIGEGFIERDLRESQYIAKKAKEMLQELCRTVVSTTGSITDTLREDWGLINTMKELNLDKYKALGLTEVHENRDGKKIERIKDWTKRNDHRHHAMDALTVAFTKHNHIQYLNNLHARKNEHHKKHGNIIAIEKKELCRDENGKKKFNLPMPHFRTQAREHLNNILISHKAKNKVVTRNKNKIKGSDIVQTALTPRGQLHLETVYGKSLKYQTKEVAVGTKFDADTIAMVANKIYREALLKRLAGNGNDPKKAFGGKNSLKKNPVVCANNTKVPEKVKLVWLDKQYTIRKDITPDLKIDKVIDKGIQNLLKKRLEAFGGNTKEAFSNLDKNPIWLNKEKGIAIKRVTISGINNAEALHVKSDHLGKPITDDNGQNVPVDFVNTGNNHHVAIYKDEKGNLQEEVVSFYEAVARVNAGVPIIKTEHEKGWSFLFTMKQNEMFVFPSDDFNPNEVDLLNTDNYCLISPNLFRVQTLSVVRYGNNTIRDFKFKHHLETIATENKVMKGITYHQIKSLEPLSKIIKVRTNHLGKIVHVGE
ncbi:type II CRISPR RNA-guided endonuclease Cas9 [Carboxylicivirga sp. A043]|uniref:type II CRISPR RNA-guided endonuclease Cas9 n=1 Tax=Carboxylicivirga litoralis TaxID=2816963 RepID=UPI0021CB5F70|nr:type II CRISPR RNA-guided endonuclease Cas9 [Carboxylicivirga sp. A043]MCU4155618.1 type II CRISPR RNA-guided endonuclease Cas9 [Carboxylicivirga sp. A043]